MKRNCFVPSMPAYGAVRLFPTDLSRGSFPKDRIFFRCFRMNGDARREPPDFGPRRAYPGRRDQCVCGGTVGPSDGCTTTKPGPWKEYCRASPEPPRSIDFMFMLLTTLGERFADQQTADCGSTKVGCCEQSRIIGWPSEVRATSPLPWMRVLNSPPENMPAPLVRWTSQCRLASKANRLEPLT